MPAWTEEEDNLLREYGKPYSTVATKLGRSVNAVQKRAIRLGLSGTNAPWTKKEDLILKGAQSAEEAMDALPDRTPEAVRKRALRLGVHYSAEKAPERRVSSRGYIYVKIRGKWRPEHRVVAERILGHKLLSWEHVHHIDGRKTNNHPDNLFVCTNRQHAHAHRSLLDILPCLMDSGAVDFDRELGEYVATPFAPHLATPIGDG